ncbi:MAG: Ig-like domain-containing protein, partial [Rhodothermales bacterium]|nr:Ig-like domain-containing protein [Rhodothermales bacterium]
VTLASVTSGDANISLGTTTSDTVTISDDDAATVTISATDASASEPSDDGQFTVSLSKASDTDTVVSYTVGGDASAGVDYATLNGSVTILAGQTSATIAVDVSDDNVLEDDETVTVTLASVTSGDANISLGTTTSDTVTISDDDIPAPTITLDTDITADDVVNEAESNATVTITGTVGGDAKAGDKIELFLSDGSTTRTYTGTVNADGTSFSIDVDGSALVSDADNTIEGKVTSVSSAGTGTATDTESYTVDTVPPTLTITSADDKLTDGETTTVTFTFSEKVKAFTDADITVTGGTLDNISTLDDGITWTARFTPTDAFDGTATVTVADDTYSDLAGNDGSGDTHNLTIATISPTLAITVSDAELKGGETSDVTFTFSEAVLGFVDSDISVSGGSLSGVTTTDGGVTWSAVFTPSEGFEGSGSITVADDTYTDVDLNDGTGDSATLTIDTKLPEATITLDPSITDDDVINATESTSDIPVTGIVGGDVKAGDTVKLVINGNEFSGAVLADGTFRITVAGSDLLADPDSKIESSVSTSDDAGNTASASDSETYSIETGIPTFEDQTHSYPESR